MNYYLCRFQEVCRPRLNFLIVTTLLLVLSYSLFLNFSLTRAKALSQQLLSISSLMQQAKAIHDINSEARRHLRP